MVCILSAWLIALYRHKSCLLFACLFHSVFTPASRFAVVVYYKLFKCSCSSCLFVCVCVPASANGRLFNSYVAICILKRALERISTIVESKRHSFALGFIEFRIYSSFSCFYVFVCSWRLGNNGNIFSDCVILLYKVRWLYVSVRTW